MVMVSPGGRTSGSADWNGRGRRSAQSRAHGPRAASASSSPGLEVVEHLGVAGDVVVVDPPAQHVRAQLVGAVRPPSSPSPASPASTQSPAGSGRPARSCPARRAPAARFGSWVATPTGQVLVWQQLGLDAADRHHHRRAPSWCSRRPGSSRLTMSMPVATLPLAPTLTWSRRPDADQGVVHVEQALGQRRADVVLVLQRRRAGAALAAVDDDEVGRDALGDHRLADRRGSRAREPRQSLNPAGLPPDSSRIRADEQHQLARRGEDPVRRRARRTSRPCGTPRASAISWRHLGARQHAADARLRALAELERDHLDLVVGGRVARTSPGRSRRPWCARRSSRCRSPRRGRRPAGGSG